MRVVRVVERTQIPKQRLFPRAHAQVSIALGMNVRTIDQSQNSTGIESNPFPVCGARRCNKFLRICEM